MDPDWTASRLRHPVAYLDERAILSGYQRLGLTIIVRNENAEVEGRVLTGLSDADIERLDRYEGVDIGMYSRIPVSVRVGPTTMKVQAYVPNRTDSENLPMGWNYR